MSVCACGSDLFQWFILKSWPFYEIVCFVKDRCLLCLFCIRFLCDVFSVFHVACFNFFTLCVNFLCVFLGVFLLRFFKR